MQLDFQALSCDYIRDPFLMIDLPAARALEARTQRAHLQQLEANGPFIRTVLWSSETMTQLCQQVHLCIGSHFTFE